jgi:hypothetical protein
MTPVKTFSINNLNFKNMVTISGYNELVNKEGKPFYSLTVQGGLEMVLSEESGRYYATKKQASVTSTLDEKTCQGLIGTKLPGKISRVVCDPYEYTVQETGEVITLTHRWAYSPNESSLEEVVYEREPVEVVSEF